MCMLCYRFFFLMLRRPPRSTRTDTRLPYTTLFRSTQVGYVDRGMKIEAIDVTLVDVPASRPIQMSFTTMQKQSYAIVQIRAGGLVGIGEGSSVGGPTWSSECAETIKRSEEHTSELQSLMRISYAVFCLKKKNNIQRKKRKS